MATVYDRVAKSLLVEAWIESLEEIFLRVLKMQRTMLENVELLASLGPRPSDPVLALDDSVQTVQMVYVPNVFGLLLDSIVRLVDSVHQSNLFCATTWVECPMMVLSGILSPVPMLGWAQSDLVIAIQPWQGLVG